MIMALPDELQRDWMYQSVALQRLRMSRSAFHRKRKLGLFECRRWGNKIIVKKSDVSRYLKASNLPVA